MYTNIFLSKFCFKFKNCKVGALWKKWLFKATIFGMLMVAGAAKALEISNPVESNSFQELLLSLAAAVRTVAIPFAVLALVFAGFKFVTASASGNTKGVGEARTMLVWIVVGTAIIVGATFLVQLTISTVNSVIK